MVARAARNPVAAAGVSMARIADEPLAILARSSDPGGTDMDSTTRRPRRPLLLLFTVLATAALILGCAGSGAAPAPAGAPEGDGTGRSDDVGGLQPGPTSGPAGLPDLPFDQALIVRTGSLELEVKDFDAALARARTAIAGLGGYVSGSQQALEGDRPYGSITYRVPSSRWDDAIAALKGLATKVVREQTQAVEVTKTVVDLEAHIANLRATEQQLLAIMTKAVKITDILEVQGQLTTVRGEIEQLVGERDGLKDQAAYGTLTVGWSTPVVAAVASVQQGFDPATIVDQAVAQLVQLGQGLLTVGIWLAIVGLPLLIAGLLVLGVVLLVTRRMGIGRRPPVGPDAGVSPV
jgi:hypothetical protein